MINNILFWPQFFVLFTASLVGSFAILPYSMRLLKESAQRKPLRMSLPKIMLLSVLQNVILFAIVVGVGLFTAHAIGLGAPYVEGLLGGSKTAQSIMSMLETAISFGIVAGAFLLIADLFFLPYWPQAIIDTTRKTTTWENFSASFYGGINEEILIRLFGLSILAWALSMVWHTSAGLPTGVVLWTANVIMAIIFGIGHLPALKGLIGKISPIMFTRSLLLNAPIGLICGWLFWTYGIEAAIVAHFSADIVYHVFGTFILKRKLSSSI
jgi:hypothetical protein